MAAERSLAGVERGRAATLRWSEVVRVAAQSSKERHAPSEGEASAANRAGTSYLRPSAMARRCVGARNHSSRPVERGGRASTLKAATAAFLKGKGASSAEPVIK